MTERSNSAETRAEAAARLRRDAERAAGGLPALQATAERLAATVAFGVHGRRRPGMGETFWQYRRATPGDAATNIDWRRSARSDALFVRETEWEAAQTVWLWCDRSASMRYRSKPNLPRKVDRAAEIVAALAVLLARGGERLAAVGGELDGAARPAPGERQLGRILQTLVRETDEDFAAAPRIDAAKGGRIVLASDFFGEEAPLAATIATLAARGVTGLVVQVLDPAEESFPFDGRLVFESMGGTLRYETERARALGEDYRAALAARRARLADVVRRAGWRLTTHRTSESAAPTLLWLVRGLADADRFGGR